MNANVKHKKSRNVSKLPELISYAVSGIKQVEYWSITDEGGCNSQDKYLPFKRPKRSSSAPSVRYKYYKRIARHIKNTLFNSKTRKAAPITLGTYRRYLSQIRREIKTQVNSNHPDFSNNLYILADKYYNYISLLEKLESSDASNIGAVYKEVLDDLKSRRNDDADSLYNELRKIEYKHPIMKLLTISDVQYARWNEQLNSNLSERKNNQTEFNYHKIMSIIDLCFKKDDFYHLLTGIALATGRRAVEIAYQGNFEVKGSYELLFSGQAKKGVGIKTKPYSIPTLIKTDRIMSAFQKLRKSKLYLSLVADYDEQPEKLRNQAINQKIGRRSNYTVKRLLDPRAKTAANGTLKSKVQFKDTRGIAVRIALDLIRPKRFVNVDENAFIAAYCGHGSYKESSNYQHIKINMDKPEIETQDTKEAIEASDSNKKTVIDISDLEAIDLIIDSTRDRAVIKQHGRVKDFAKQTGWKLNQSAIYKGKKVDGAITKAGGSLVVVKRYLAIEGVSNAIKRYNTSNHH